MSDTKWLLQHGFEEVEKLPNGFSLLVMIFMRIVQFRILMIALKVENVPTNREWWLIIPIVAIYGLFVIVKTCSDSFFVR